jgi:hypothetical protein
VKHEVEGCLVFHEVIDAGSKIGNRQADKRAEESLRQSEAYLAEAQRLSHTGSFGWRPSTGEILWSEETFESSNTTERRNRPSNLSSNGFIRTMRPW